MQVGLRKYYVARQYEARRKANSKAYQPCTNLCSNVMSAIEMYVLAFENEVVSEVLQANVEHSIGAATSQVSKGLGRDDFGKGPMEKVNNS